MSRRNALLERIYIAYGRRLIRRSFSAVDVSYADANASTSWAASDAPSIAFFNHSAWWDAVVPFVLSHDLFRRVSYGVMEGAQLQRYPFFQRLGCFGATTNSLTDARAIQHHAIAALRRGGRGNRSTLWLAPQGALLPARTPLQFRSGLARIARAVPEATLVPVALRFEFGTAQRPTCFVRVGIPAPPVTSDESIRHATLRLTTALADEVAALDRMVLARTG